MPDVGQDRPKRQPRIWSAPHRIVLQISDRDHLGATIESKPSLPRLIFAPGGSPGAIKWILIDEPWYQSSETCLSMGAPSSVVHSAIEPSYMELSLFPNSAYSANQPSDAQWPVLQKVIDLPRVGALLIL